MKKKSTAKSQEMYRFDAKSSQLWEFACFPSIVRKKISDDDNKSIDPYSRINDNQYKDLLKEIQTALKPFKSDIESFYYEDEAHFINLLLMNRSFFNAGTFFNFIEDSKRLTTNVLRTSILYATSTQGDYLTFQEDLWQQAEQAAEQPEYFMPRLNERDLSAETKWHLYTILQDPHAALERYEKLMKSIEPIFERFYKPYAERIEQDGTALINELKELGDKPFSKITQGILNDDLVKEHPLLIVYSYFHAYSIMFSPSSACPFMTWGHEVQSMFEKLKALNEEQLTERLQVFKNLGDKTRYDVLKCVASGITSTKVIAEQLGVTSATISYHLSSLTTAKLILLVQQDQKLIQTLNKELLRKHLEALKEEFGL